MYYIRLKTNNDEILSEQFFSDIEDALQSANKLFNGIKTDKKLKVVLERDEANSIPPMELLNLSVGE